MNQRSHPAAPDPSTRPSTRRSPMVVLLVCTLCLLTGILLARSLRPALPPSGQLPIDIQAALAAPSGVVAQTGGLTVLTTETGNEDLLVVLDARTEELFVYRTDLKSGMQLLQRYPVPQLFTDARARTTGGP